MTTLTTAPAPATPTPPSVELFDLRKVFGDTMAVDGVSLTVEQGEFLTLLGPSGCGKTTTLRLIAGLEQPTSGEVRIHGKSMVGRPAFKRPVNTVFQNYALFPHLDLLENVAFGLRMAGIARDERHARARDALAMVRLAGYEHRRTHELSGGEQQRAALARALVNRPTVLLLDEPLGALDLRLRKDMQLELKGLNRQVGITFIYVTHDQEEAIVMSDRIAVMLRGRILQVAPPMDIYRRPTSRFVAEFVGETNVLAGSARATESGWAQVQLAGLGSLRGRLAESLDGEAAASVSFRPEWVSIGPAEAREEESAGAMSNGRLNRVFGSVVQMLFQGPDVVYHVMLPGGHVLRARRPIEAVESGSTRLGDQVALSFPVEETMVLVR
jgi:spermidine/putrescine transport system ATP-binding protein